MVVLEAHTGQYNRGYRLDTVGTAYATRSLRIARYILWRCVLLSDHLSVTLVYCIETAEPTTKLEIPRCSSHDHFSYTFFPHVTANIYL